MPQRRKVRTTTKRPKVTLPDGKEGEDLPEETRQKKLEVLLKDFDDDVEQRISNTMERMNGLMKEIESMYTLELLKIPKDLRNVKMSDYLKVGRSVDEIRQMQSRQQSVQQIEALMKPLTVKKGNSKVMDPIQEENQNPMAPPKTTRGTRTAKTASRTTRMTRKAAMETPMHQFHQTAGWETPMVTPRFDPRLPITPAVRRQQQPNEQVIKVLTTVSENGSPLANVLNGTEEQEFQVPIGRQRTLCIPTAHKLNPAELPTLDEEAMARLIHLNENITAILNKQLKK